MATVVDSLLIELGFSGKAAIDGLKNTDESLDKVKSKASNTAKEMEHSGKQAASFFREIRNEALLLISLVAGSTVVEQFVKNTVGGMEKLGFTAENLQLPTEQIMAWTLAAEKAGSTAEGITAAIAKANEEAVNIKAGKLEGVSEYKGSPLGYFAQGGRDSELHKDGLAILLEKNRIISKVRQEKGESYAKSVAAEMGINADTFNLLKETPDAVLALVKAQEKNAVVSAKNADQAHKFANQVRVLGDGFEALKIKIALALLPTFERWVKAFDTWFDAHQDKIVTTINKWSESLMKFAVKIDEIAQSMGGWGTIITALITIKLGAWVADLLLMAGALLKVSAGFSAVSVAGSAASGYMIGTWLNDKITGALGQPLGGAIYDATHSDASIADSAFAKLISKGEGGYNSVNRGAKGAGTADLENMSVYDVFAAQKRGEFGAAGRYQLINSTLTDAMKTLNLNPMVKFNKETQDKIFAQYLIKNKRSAIGDYLFGKSEDLVSAGIASSKEWASIADPATGKSHYAGIGNNRASISADQIKMALKSSRQIPGSTNTNTSDTRIGTINIQTQATDAKGIAAGIKSAMMGDDLFYNVNTGMR